MIACITQRNSQVTGIRIILITVLHTESKWPQLSTINILVYHSAASSGTSVYHTAMKGDIYSFQMRDRYLISFKRLYRPLCSPSLNLQLKCAMVSMLKLKQFGAFILAATVLLLLMAFYIRYVVHGTRSPRRDVKYCLLQKARPT